MRVIQCVPRFTGSLPVISSDVSENQSEYPDAVSEAMALTRQIAEPRLVGDSVKSAVRRSAQRLGWSFSRTKDIWYGAARRIDVMEMDRLRNLAKERRRQDEATLHEIESLRARLARIERHLEIADDVGANPYPDRERLR